MPAAASDAAFGVLLHGCLQGGDAECAGADPHTEGNHEDRLIQEPQGARGRAERDARQHRPQASGDSGVFVRQPA
eukprot:CAMPEP_0179345132 /NCGR_PEP_ID=MMETSP0797-20121207/71878_1 /TAXON_ID=47934 /ORGANISM="Dinophysis acuminata, Strain DAEP01" /LENGTH=74 /DNA_ID=CAMNT_0021059595 /DNA_START=43 /DNA_END=267 /DNA_ORIENTATION=+